MRDGWFLFCVVGLIALGILAGFGLFSPEARLRRRRRKSHNPIVSKTNRPSVRFRVKAPKEGRNERGRGK